MSRPFPAVVKAAAVTLLVLAACGSEPPPAPSASSPPSIVVITIDALRWDHVGWAGHLRPTTPFLDSLRAGGTAFTKASSVSSWTVPALASLLTGVYPPSHGVLHGTGFDDSGRIKDQEVIPESLPLLSEKMQELGYETYGVVANLHGHGDFGYQRGFDHFRCVGFRSAAAVQRTLEQWQPQIARAQGPVFLWIHYFDPHWPYHLREPWSGRFAGPSAAAALTSVQEITEVWPGLPRDMALSLADRMEAARALYDAEIAHTDRMIEEAFQLLPELFDWFAIISADHGEEFFDHGQLEHSWNLFEETVRIPFIVRLPGGGGPATVNAPVGLIDIPPTVLRLAGGEAPASWGGEPLVDELGRVRTDLRDGRTMLSFLDRSETRRHRVALTGPRWKLITDSRLEQRWLFDLENDPLERHDLAAAYPELAEQLEDELRQRLGELPPAPAVLPTVGLSAEQIRELQAIGYLDRE